MTYSFLVDFSSPVSNVIIDDFRCLADSEVTTNGLDKVALGICEIEMSVVSQT